MFTPPTWLRRLIGVYDRVPRWVRWAAGGLVLFFLGAVLL